MSSEGELRNDGVVLLEDCESINNARDSNLGENTSLSKKSEGKEAMVTDSQDQSENNANGINNESNITEMMDTDINIDHNNEAVETYQGSVADKFDGNTSVEGKTNEKDGEDVTVETSNLNEDDKLLSEISELVDKESCEDDFSSNTEARNKDEYVNEEVNENMETEDIMEKGKPGEAESEEVDEGNITTSDDLKGTSIQEEVVVDGKDTSTGKSEKTKESAVQRLASLGLITQEEPVVEDKETVLKKLASRGGISIMPAGSLSSAAGSSVSVKPSPVKPVSIKQSNVQASPQSVTSPNLVTSHNTTLPSSPYKPGPKSAKKKLKIDPAKSADIDKDFNSLINFLSTGADLNSASVTSSTPEKDICNETVSENVNVPNPNVQLEANETSNQSAIDGQISGTDIDDRSLHESESEGHDDSKFEQSSEIDDRTPTINRNVIEEGSAEILLSANKNVFYNKVQEFNRDMSIAALTVFSEMHQQDPRTRNRGKKRKAGGDCNETDNLVNCGDENVFEAGKKSENGITILEALSATGLRSIRYAREIPGVKEVIANDLSGDAVDTIKKNVEHNGVGEMVTTSMSDASLLMYQRQAGQEWYDAVDLDPYGCPARFLDAAVQAVRDGGLLLVTCTDMAVLAGNSPETCYVKYGAVSMRMAACHEMALRIALQCIESHANRYGRYIVPLLSFSADFYIRLIVQVYTSPVTCKRTTSKLSMVYQCVGCGTHSLQPLGNMSQVSHNAQPKFSLPHGPPVGTTCLHCQHKHCIGGPIWSAPIYSTKFVESMLRVVESGRFGTGKRMQGMLEVIREELQDVPLYYTVASLCTRLHCQAIPLIDIRSAILNAGYRVSSSHAAPTAVKTNAPSKVIWDIMRCWVHMNPVSQKRLAAGSVSAAIIMEPPNLIANFDIHPRARPSSATRRLVRYQQNPEKNWGPGTRARCNNAEETNDEKRRVNQNKNKNKKHIDIIEVVTIDDEDEIVEEYKTPEPDTPQTTDKESNSG